MYLPSQIHKAIPDQYAFRSLSIEAAGTVAKNGDGYEFTARGSGTKFDLEPNDDLKKLVEEGKTNLTLRGKVTEPKEEDADGKKKPPFIKVTGAKETEKTEEKK